MLNVKATATNLILVFVAGGSWWLADYLFPKDSVAPKADASQIDYYSKNIHRTVLDVEGKPKEVLFARLMVHYKNDDRTAMELPVMTLYKQEGAPWVIESERGTSLAQGKTVLMEGKVVVTRKDDDGGELKIITSNVKYLPDTDYAETAERVLMLGKDDATSATGAQVYFEPVLTINLLADVRRKHEMR